ncbi:hypothetical protein P3X46_021792 [Hevea brasiliensis]|uniref:Epidermal patterning factor-like protein n=1 Tax=Hevea brasiliensis TaxID=3981 RepID=A0ABQ9LGP2_HEVBR|nr:protein EPIDERMAL PATTERNING FACTOR 2 isoform X2 [Hevea brasiliensis]KAJ9167117.1 hypothetical protein P3X46_021792 [Hevea brasiliensis]
MKLFFGAHKIFLLVLIFMALMILVTLRKQVALNGDEQSYRYPKLGAREKLGMELYPTGSSLPDCSHACGPCFPCKRVMVSFKCSIGESCPIVYRCMCKGKYYHVPSA